MRQRSYLKKTSAPLAAKPMENIKAILQYAAVLLTILVALFYYFGYLYYSNLIAYWGLSTNMFSLTREETIIVGAVQFTSVAMRLIAGNIILLVSVVILVLLGIVISSIRSLRDYFTEQITVLRRHLRGIRHHVVITDNHDKTMNIVQYINMRLLVVFLILYFIIICSQQTMIRANNDSKKSYAQMIANKPSDSPFSSRALVNVKNERSTFDTYSGQLIKTSATHCALYDKNKGVMIFPLANVSRLVICEHRASANK